MTRRRIAVGIAALVAAGLALFWWSHRAGEQSATSSNARGAHGAVGALKTDPTSGLPSWLAQRGVGARRVAGVVMRDGAPVAGATVRLASNASAAGIWPEPKLVTDASGRFDFGSQLAMQFLVSAEAPHVLGAWLSFDARDSTEKLEDIVLVLHACDVSIFGSVRDTSGGIVARARVARMSWAMGPGTESGDDGSYELCLEPGSSFVTVRAEGYGRVSDQLTAYGRVHRDFELSPEATIAGRVIRADDKSPVAGAVVELRSDDDFDRNDYLTRRVATDSDGAFHVDALKPGSYSVSASADRLASTRVIHAEADVGATRETVTCRLAPTLVISGKVVEHGTAKPVAGIGVSMSVRGRPHSIDLEAVSQPDGTFVVTGALPGLYQPVVDPYDPAAKPLATVQVDKADVTGVTIEIDHLGSISGRVTRDGKPVDGAEVDARGPTPRNDHTDHDGRFELTFLREGAYQIYAQSERIGGFTNGPTITLGKNEKKTGVEVAIDLEASIAGTVVDQSDAPVAGAVVRFEVARGEDMGTATSGQDGTFVARALSGGGDYVYKVFADESSAVSYPAADGKRFAPIRVRDGKSHVSGVRIKIRVDQTSISGHVVDVAGKPAPDVRVTAVRRGGMDESLLKPTTTDMAGAFTVRGLPRGNYELIAQSASANERIEDVAAGRNDVVIKLADSGGIDGTLEGFGDDVEVMAWRQGGFRAYYANASTRAFELRRLPVGEYRVIAQSSNGYVEAVAKIEAAVNAKVTLRALALGAVDVIVTDDAHAPVADLWCRANSLDWEEHTTDASGAVHIDRATPGNSEVDCYGRVGFASGHVDVISGQTARIELVIRKPAASHTHIGMSLEEKLENVVVKTIAPGGPADRAGIAVGDIVVTVAGKSATEENVPAEIESAGVGAQVPFTLERDGKQFTVTVTVEAAPAP